jgi:hypothetical protein
MLLVTDMQLASTRRAQLEKLELQLESQRGSGRGLRPRALTDPFPPSPLSILLNKKQKITPSQQPPFLNPPLIFWLFS